MPFPSVHLLVVLLQHQHVDETLFTVSAAKLRAISNFSFWDISGVQFQIFCRHFLLLPCHFLLVQDFAVAGHLVHRLEGLAVGGEEEGAWVSGLDGHFGFLANLLPPSRHLGLTKKAHVASKTARG